MSQSHSESAPNSDVPYPRDFNGSGGMGLAEILQMSCLNRRSGQITFHSGPSYGFVFIQQGRPLHAMCGTVEGEEAVYLMLSWPAGSYTLDEDILPHKRTIQMTWEQLLFEGARRADVGSVATHPGAPVTTANPLTTTRAKDSLPKLIISRGDEPPVTVELQQEYSRLGRAEDNELFLMDPSVSNRHCIFILSGPDVVLRDLNSSNGTYVNGENISETILRPGDNIQVGVIDIKFVPGVRRPRLTNTSQTSAPARTSSTKRDLPSMEPARSNTTLKLPFRAPREDPAPRMLDNSAFVSGASAISYDQLAPEAEAKPARSWVKIIGGIVVLLLIIGGVAYYLLVLKH